VPTPVTATATAGGSVANGLLLRVKVLTGASVNQFGGTAGTGSTSPFTPSLSLTTTVTGSWVYGALVNGQTSTNGSAFTPAAGNSLIDSFTDAPNAEQYGTTRTTAQTGTPGSTTVGASAPTMTGSIAFAEIVPDAGGLAEDPSGPAVATNTGGTSVASASFTPPPGSLLVAMVASDGGSGVTTMALSGGGLTWTPLIEAHGSQNDYAGIWIARVGPPDPNDPVITAQQGGSTTAGIAMRIYVLTAAATGQPGGVSNNQFLNTATFTQAVTTTQTGSRVYGASSVFPSTSAVAAAATTVVDNILDSTHNARYVTFKATALTGTPGATTLGFTVTGTNTGPFAQAEILSNGTLTEDVSAPPVASDTANTFVSCAGFTPPAGSLIVILIASNGGAAVTTMGVSGGGLTYVEVAKNNPSGGDYAGVWVAQVGSGGGPPVPPQPGGQRWRHVWRRPQATAPTLASTVVAGAATLNGTGSIDTALAVQQDGAALAAAGSVSTAAAQQAGAALSGAGSVGTPAVVQGSPTTLAGAGLIGTPAATQGGGGTLGGAGSFGTAATQLAPATLGGAGSIAAPSAQQAGATLNGTGSVGTPAVVQQAGAALAGAGSITGTGGSSGASLTGTGTLAALAILLAPATLGAAGSLASAAALLAPAALAGTGSIGTPPAVQGSPTGLAGAGSLATAATLLAPATLAAAGQLATAGTLLAPATLAGTGTINAPAPILQSTATLAGAGAVTTAAALRGIATLAGTGSISGTGSGAGATLAAVGTLTAGGYFAGFVSLAGTGSLATAIRILVPAALAGTGTLAALAAARAAAALAAAGSLAGTGVVIIPASVGTGRIGAGPAAAGTTGSGGPAGTTRAGGTAGSGTTGGMP
jgi:hypothetical protein